MVSGEWVVSNIEEFSKLKTTYSPLTIHHSPGEIVSGEWSVVSQSFPVREEFSKLKTAYSPLTIHHSPLFINFED